MSTVYTAALKDPGGIQLLQSPLMGFLLPVGRRVVDDAWIQTPESIRTQQPTESHINTIMLKCDTPSDNDKQIRRNSTVVCTRKLKGRVPAAANPI